MDEVTQKLLDTRDQLRSNAKGKPQDEDDPIKALMLDGVSAHKPPGELATFCKIIEDSFERREGCELYRIIGALGAAQIIVGRNVLTPTDSKAMFQMMLVAPSGSGKTAAVDFVASASHALGLMHRYRGSTVTSLKQLQMAAIEAEGSLVYVVDDNESHVLNWDNERSSLEGISNFIRATSSSNVPWMAPSPIRREFNEILTSAGSVKMIEAKARAEGWLLPRVDGTKEIDFIKFATQNQDVAKQYAKAKRDADMAQNPIERMKVVPVISLTPDAAKKIISNWQSNGSMGRTFFICSQNDIAEKKSMPSAWNSRSFVNEWKARIPHALIKAKWGDGAFERYLQRDAQIDSLRNEGGITGSVSARYGQLIIDMATLCAFFDTTARSGNDFSVGVKHIDWAYQAALESLLAMRDYTEGDPVENGLEINEWESILSKIRKCVEGSAKFKKFQTVSIIKDRICRDHVKTIIDACTSSGMTMNAEIFTYRVLECIGQYRYAPVALDEENTKKVQLIETGRWNDIPMTNDMRTLLTTALRRMRFMKK